MEPYGGGGEFAMLASMQILNLCVVYKYCSF